KVKDTASSLTSSVENTNGQISTLQVKADSLTSTLSNGGVNLLSNTRELNDPSIWTNLGAWDKGDFYNDGITKCQIIQTSSQQWLGVFQPIFVVAGKKYTFSIDAKSGDDNNHAAFFFCDAQSLLVQENRASAIGNIQTFTYTPTWTRYSFTITATTDGYVCPRIERGMNDGLLQLARPQFECGEIATPWQPSNGDFFALQQTANAAKQKADANASGIQAMSDETQRAISNLKSEMTRLMSQAAYVPIQIGNQTDLNNMKTCGFYLLQGGTINSPVSGWTYVKVQGIPNRLTQFAWHDINPSEQWCRLYSDNSWTEWTRYTEEIKPLSFGGDRGRDRNRPIY
uniref:pyocin knob domain-containing protein n=1 Tax=Lactobacillus delbrueckii TaxID=1584 RepID=UPI0025AF1CA0